MAAVPLAEKDTASSGDEATELALDPTMPRAGPNPARAGANHARAGANHARAGPNHARAGIALNSGQIPGRY